MNPANASIVSTDDIYTSVDTEKYSSIGRHIGYRTIVSISHILVPSLLSIIRIVGAVNVRANYCRMVRLCHK